MSSNSSGTEALARPEQVGDLIAESFAMIEREVPAAHRRICDELAGRTVSILVDEESFAVVFAEGTVGVHPVDLPAGAARIVTECRAILDLIDARVTLAQAVLSDSVRALAPLDILAELREGLRLYVHGTARCPSATALLERFRALAERRSQATEETS